MIKKNVCYISMLAFLLLRCDNEELKFQAHSGDDMEGTIPRNINLTFKKTNTNEIHRNDIVIFKYREKRYGISSYKILRVVGLPGDEITIKKGQIFINDSLFNLPLTSKFSYYVQGKSNLRDGLLQNYYFRQQSHNEFIVFLDHYEYAKFKNSPLVDSISALISDSTFKEREIIHNDNFNGFNSYFFGPLRIPRIGDTINQNLASIVPNYIDKDNIGKPIKGNLFFLIADNRFYGRDSRYLGLIPDSVIMGKLEVAK